MLENFSEGRFSVMKRKLLSILLILTIVCPIVGIPVYAKNDDMAAENNHHLSTVIIA